MNKYTALLPKYLKIIAFLALVLGIFFGFSQVFQASSVLHENASNETANYRAAFFKALQEHDLSKARLAYEKLKTLLPADDQFLTQIAPSHMADLYLTYAQTLHYDPEAHDLMLTQARYLAPNHPKLLVMKPKLPPVEQAPEMIPQEEEVAMVPENEPTPVITVAIEPPPAMSTEIPLHEQFPDSVAKTEEIKDGPPRIPYIDPPPLSPIQEPLTEEDLLGISAPEPPAPQAAAPMTQDPCALSFFSRTQPLTACIDPVASNRYGPALFVIGNAYNQPMIAFSQAALSHQEYDVYCEATNECTDATMTPQALIDLKDVEETVSDYNAYCQMTGSCAKINAQSASKRSPLTPSQVQRYALWLSKQTGYHYHRPTEQNIVAIQVYFQQCVNAKACPPGLLQSLESLLADPDTLLVRDIAMR